MNSRDSGDKVVQMQRQPPAAMHLVREHEQLGAIDNKAIIDGLFSLLEGTPGFATITNIDGAVMYMNDHGRKTLGIQDPAAVKGRLLSQNYPDDAADFLFRQAIPAAKQNGAWRGEMTMVDVHGVEIPVSQVIIFQDTAGDHGLLLSIAWDMRKEKRTEKLLRHKATHDELTDLPNRSLTMDRLEQALHTAQREKNLAAVVFMDIDRFKQLNDRFGHEAANQVLYDLSRRLSSCTRSVDTVGRYGGDEFVLVLPNLRDTGRLALVLKRVRKSIADPFTVGNRQIYLTMSMGLAVFPGDGVDAGELLQRADQDMYRQKRQRAAARERTTPACAELSGHAKQDPDDFIGRRMQVI